MLSTIRKIYEQQHHMYTQRTYQIENCIVSISQWYRPWEGQGGCEFGGKVAICIVEGYSYMEMLSWDQ